MSEREMIMFMEKENLRLSEENEKLRRVIARLNQTLNRLIGRFISSDKIA